MNITRTLLDAPAQGTLLALARSTIEAYLVSQRIIHFETSDEQLLRPSGAFVSLHRDSELRGCIGIISAEMELYRTVQRCAVSAAVEDCRFSPVTAVEIPRIQIEISVLTPSSRVEDFDLVEVGKHGLIVSRGSMRGLLLPQVAQQYRWDRKTFLEQTCRKAGLAANAWKEPGTAVYSFEAQVFSELASGYART